MKETDYKAIHDEVETQLLMTSWLILDYVELDVAIQLVFNIYLTNDILKGFGQDIEGVISVISSRDRISTIAGGHSSFYKNDSPLCYYEQLDEDVNQILIVLQASIERMEYNSE